MNKRVSGASDPGPRKLDSATTSVLPLIHDMACAHPLRSVARHTFTNRHLCLIRLRSLPRMCFAPVCLLLMIACTDSQAVEQLCGTPGMLHFVASLRCALYTGVITLTYAYLQPNHSHSTGRTAVFSTRAPNCVARSHNQPSSAPCR